jgi:hypothetical protein
MLFYHKYSYYNKSLLFQNIIQQEFIVIYLAKVFVTIYLRKLMIAPIFTPV